ncbi:MAG: hypothetical protein JSV64_06600 [Candidatus Bathyarchaeota archaeon]|nr:MAG: hypothetical protein JSV64_06600 [Candidatus Bathyarchaeota archaeon]
MSWSNVRSLTVIYWIRASLGVVIGLLCGAYLILSATSEFYDFFTLLTGLSFALLFYLATYYIIKFRFLSKVEKSSKLMTQGIGIYFFGWIVSWTFIISLIMPSVSVSIYRGSSLAVGQELWISAESLEGPTFINRTTDSATLRLTLLPPGTYVLRLGGDLTGYDVVNQNQTINLEWLDSRDLEFNITPVTG